VWGGVDGIGEGGDDIGEGGEDAESEFINIIDGKTVAQLYKESLEDDEEEPPPPQPLSFVSNSLKEGRIQNFSRYDRGSYSKLFSL